jgi:ferredoxin-NADP reductase
MDQKVVPGGRLAWQEATVAAIRPLTPRVKSFLLKVPGWHGFRAGQHVDVRLTAPDGYQAERSYSIGSPPEASEVELIVERLDDGEVSPFFHEIVQPGDTIELRGPIGGHFAWEHKDGGPLLLVGGGSGVVPLLSMLRHRASVALDVPAALIYSARAREELIGTEELLQRAENEANFSLFVTLTRENGVPQPFRTGRIGADLIGEVLASFGAAPRHSYVCGSTAFVDSATRLLLDMDVPFPSIKTERYGGDPARHDASGPPGP